MCAKPRFGRLFRRALGDATITPPIPLIVSSRRSPRNKAAAHETILLEPRKNTERPRD
jgi:hypothetical protein